MGVPSLLLIGPTLHRESPHVLYINKCEDLRTNMVVWKFPVEYSSFIVLDLWETFLSAALCVGIA